MSTDTLLDLGTAAGRAEMAAKLVSLGVTLTPPMLMGTIGLYAPYHRPSSGPSEPLSKATPCPTPAVAVRATAFAQRTDTLSVGAEPSSLTPQSGEATGVKIVRDLQYGPDGRHRLDVFAPENSGAARLPVLMFVHGGGFIQGDKTTAGSPFYDNVGLWAVRHGCIGVTMTYRLAPANRWPAGADDVAAATSYLREQIAKYGGDSNKLFVMGQSAGAVHVGSYIAREHSAKSSGWHPAGAVLVSGLFDTHTMEKNMFFEAYFGADPVGYADRPFLADLAGTPVPLMVAVAEYDPLDFLRQHVALLDAYVKAHNRLPYVVPLQGHNHLSTVLHLNTADEALSKHLSNFMKV